MIAVLTAVYDSYDSLKDFPPQNVHVDTICVTDDPDLRSSTWRVVYEPRGWVHPNRAAKHPKMRPWDYTDCTESVWIDASLNVTSESFVNDVLEIADPIAQFVHPQRDCIYDEADYSLGWTAKYGTEPLRAQCDRYRRWEHPAHWGLWNTGIMARHHTPEVVELGNQWLEEVYDWSFQDQVSEPPLLRKLGMRPNTLPGSYWAGQNPWLAWHGSERH